MLLLIFGFSLAIGKPNKAEGLSSSTFKGQYGYQMILIKAGTFSMGSKDSVKNGISADEISHEVILSRSIYAGRTEVTRGLWQKIMGTDPALRNGDECFRSDDPVYLNSQFPVFCVDFHEVIAFANLMSSWEEMQECYIEKKGRVYWEKKNCNGYRLPTEAEWEYIATAQTESVYSGGDKLADVGWSVENSGLHANPVAQKKPNAFQLYDLSGNVWEWTWDWYGPYSKNERDPSGPYIGAERVVRGGSWSNFSVELRIKNRFSRTPKHRNSQLGFRLVRTVK